MQSIHIVRLAAAGLALSIAAASAAPLSAQRTAPAATAHGPGRGRMFAGLNLTDAQKAQIKTIHEKYRAQLSSGNAAAKPDLEAARAARARGDTAAARAAFQRARTAMEVNKPIREREMAEIRNVLTPAQRQQFDAQRAKFKEGHKHGHGKQNGAA